MNLNKSTRILINVALVLLIALLLKSLISVPRSAVARSGSQYKVVDIADFGETNAKTLTQYINQLSEHGWRLHSLVPWIEVVIFER
ncbi:MAG: hypothetical protein ACE5LC_05765 [Candidatus Aminicenantales bacterium]